VPAVPVMVMVAVTGWWEPPPEFPPPQPVQIVSPAAQIAMHAQPLLGQRRTAMRANTHSAAGSIGVPSRRTPAVADELSVRVLETAAVEGVTLAGEKLHATLAGNPEHANETGWSKPFDGVTFTLVEALWPG